MQLTKKKTAAVVGLDVEAGSIAATEVATDGSARVTAAAIGTLADGAVEAGEVRDPDRLTAGLKELFSAHKLSRRVRLGVANQRVVIRTMRLPAIEDPEQLEAAVRFQAEEQMPMPLDQAVLAHQVIGGAPAADGAAPQLDVVVVAAMREMVTSFLGPLRAAGLEPVGIDLSAFAMIRALADSVGDGAAAAGAVGGAADAGVAADVGAAAEGGEGAPAPAAVAYCNIGDVTNLAVARGRACLFTRVSDAGLGAISSRLSGSTGLSGEHAAQWLGHVGLERPLEGIEGDPEQVAAARAALEEGVSTLLDELRLSLDYYAAQEGSVPVERVVLCGPGSAIAGLAERMEALRLPVETVRPAPLAELDDAVAARLTLPFGLSQDR